MENKLQININKSEKRADDSGFRFSVKKTKYIHFCRLRSPHNEPRLTLHGQLIECTSTSRILGITFDKKRNFKDHIENGALRCKKTISNITWGMDRNTLLRLYCPPYMLNRTKLIMRNALNKKLQEKISLFKKEKQSADHRQDEDEEYFPPENTDSDSSSSTENDGNGMELPAENIVYEQSADMNIYTKKGAIRKRKVFVETVKERLEKKYEAKVNAHKVKPPCSNSCRLKCSKKINFQRQQEINDHFWRLNELAQRTLVKSWIKKVSKKRNTTGKESSRRQHSFKYILKQENGIENFVCKTFLLSTLGYDNNNDRIIKSVRDSEFSSLTPKRDMRGKHPKIRKIDRNIIVEHIKSFRPTISHYRREHAPNRLYLPSDISVKKMYELFKVNHPNFKVSYELYRKEVCSMNISFTKLGNEECFDCEKFDLHSKSSEHTKDQLSIDCEKCNVWSKHRERYEWARQEYRKDGETNVTGTEKLTVAADLQKVIMLPRADMFKEVIFTPRIIAFNESFVPVGKFTKSVKPLAVIWHECVSGRKKEDLISTFHAFLSKNRDIRNIIIWLDNCAAQNKNWALFSYFVYAVNSNELNVELLTIKYFQAGHTFMSADSFHHQVELSLKRNPKVFDFNDFKNAVQQSNSSKVDVIDMKIENFFEWQDLSSKYKLQRISPKPYLHDMVFVQFQRNKKSLWYKNKFSDEPLELNFLTAKYYSKSNIPKAAQRNRNRGISAERKNNLISKLRPIIPANRLAFWEELQVSEEMCDDDSS
ncbi:hypothetical protein JTB14_029657 [Gonioctena quinquepunctata]|nr:hypothetical protein JTB14_029657 [Gonioctena quinquepunctata]